MDQDPRYWQSGIEIQEHTKPGLWWFGVSLASANHPELRRYAYTVYHCDDNELELWPDRRYTEAQVREWFRLRQAEGCVFEGDPFWLHDGDDRPEP